MNYKQSAISLLDLCFAQIKIQKDKRANIGFPYFMESLILAQDERWRRA